MALAKTTAEIATEKMAAAKRLEAKMVMMFSFVWFPLRLSLGVAQYIASAVPVSKNGRFLPFLGVLHYEQMFSFAIDWDISPTFGFVNSIWFTGLLTGAAFVTNATMTTPELR